MSNPDNGCKNRRVRGLGFQEFPRRFLKKNYSPPFNTLGLWSSLHHHRSLWCSDVAFLCVSWLDLLYEPAVDPDTWVCLQHSHDPLQHLRKPPSKEVNCCMAEISKPNTNQVMVMGEPPPPPPLKSTFGSTTESFIFPY